MSTRIPGKQGCPCGNPQPHLGEDADYCCVECRHCGRQGPIEANIQNALIRWNERVAARNAWSHKISSKPDPFPVPLPQDLWEIERETLRQRAKMRALGDETDGKFVQSLLSLNGRIQRRIYDQAEEQTRFPGPAKP